MRTLGTFIASAVIALMVALPASAQQPGAPRDEHHPEGQAKGSTPATPAPTPDPGMKSGAMPMMDMCRQMMGDMPMMGGGMPADPKEKADMLRMRGEMMKAMGDVMMKHARRLQGTTEK